MNGIICGQSPVKHVDAAVRGAIVEFEGKKFFRVQNYDQMRPFLMSVVSSSNHWMFVSSTGGLSCGRINPDRALFPYCTDDKVHDSASHTGPQTCLLVQASGKNSLWIPFREGFSVYTIERNLYKSVYGSRLIFEEINHDLGLVFSYEWAVGERFGFIKTSRIRNTGTEAITVEVLDGIRNLLPPGVTQDMQTRLSTLIDAYKKTELHAPSGAGIYALSSLPTDLAVPREALSAIAPRRRRRRGGLEIRSSSSVGRSSIAGSCEPATSNKSVWRWQRPEKSRGTPRDSRSSRHRCVI